MKNCHMVKMAFGCALNSAILMGNPTQLMTLESKRYMRLGIGKLIWQ